MNIRVLMEREVLKGKSYTIADPDAHFRVALFEIGGNGAVVVLPFPTNLVSSISPQWQGVDQSNQKMIGEMVSGNSYAEHLAGWSKQAKAVFQENAKKGTSDATGTIGAFVGGVDYALMKAGKSINPFREMLFDGIDFRSFRLDFEIVPKSKKESDLLVEAVKAIQMGAAPGIMDGPAGVFMDYPSRWVVFFRPTEVYLPSFMPSVITNVAVDYSGVAGSVVFTDIDAPLAVNLSISFSEVELLSRQKIESGFWG